MYAAVVINEVFPKTANPADAWIELFNNGSQQVSLDRWTLEHTAGDKKAFQMNASFIIQPRSFLTLYQPQTGITMSIEGDTVQLRNEDNAVIDSQSYPGILGYNTSVGRSQDGGGQWTTCTTPATPKLPNDCPEPTPTATPTPSPTNTPTPPAKQNPAPGDTPMPIARRDSSNPTVSPETPIFTSARRPAQSQVLGVIDSETSATKDADFRETKPYRFVWMAGMIAGLLLGVMILVAPLFRRPK